MRRLFRAGDVVVEVGLWLLSVALLAPLCEAVAGPAPPPLWRVLCVVLATFAFASLLAVRLGFALRRIPAPQALRRDLRERAPTLWAGMDADALREAIRRETLALADAEIKLAGDDMNALRAMLARLIRLDRR